MKLKLETVKYGQKEIIDDDCEFAKFYSVAICHKFLSYCVIV